MSIAHVHIVHPGQPTCAISALRSGQRVARYAGRRGVLYHHTLTGDLVTAQQVQGQTKYVATLTRVPLSRK
jgi:hypothetical protein